MRRVKHNLAEIVCGSCVHVCHLLYYYGLFQLNLYQAFAMQAYQ